MLRVTEQRGWLLLTVVIIFACVFRIVLLERYYLVPDADQTVLGLMARHILSGERPVFYWGQPYTGAGEAYLTAALFAVFGQSDLLLHIVPGVASLAFIVAVFVLGWRLYGSTIAALSGLYLSIAPILLIEWGFWAGSGYLEMMALGTFALLLVLPDEQGLGMGAWLRLPLCFFSLGLAGWAQPSAIFYLLAVLALLVGRIILVLRTPRRWAAGALLSCCCLVAGALGMAPMLVYNYQHNGETLSFLLLRGAGSAINPLTVTSRALLWSGPVLSGLIPPTTDRVYLYQFLLAHTVLYGGALALTLFLLTGGLLNWRAALARLRSITRPNPAPDLALMVLVGSVLAAFLSSNWGAAEWSESAPRYLLPLYTAVPLGIRLILPRRVTPVALALVSVGIGALLVGTVSVNFTTFSRPDFSPLARLLQQRGVTAVYGDYWTVYPLIYESMERISGVAVNDDLSRGYNRRLLYLQEAARSTHIAWVVATGSARQQAVLACLSARHSTYKVLIWHDQTIYDAPSGGAVPYWNGGRCTVVSTPTP